MTSGWISRGQRQKTTPRTSKPISKPLVPAGGFPSDDFDESWGPGSDSVSGAPKLKKSKPISSPQKPSHSSAQVTSPRSPIFQNGQRSPPSHQSKSRPKTSSHGFLEDISEGEEEEEEDFPSPVMQTLHQTPQKQQQQRSPRLGRQDGQPTSNTKTSSVLSQLRSPTSRNPFGDFMDLDDVEEEESNGKEHQTDTPRIEEEEEEEVEDEDVDSNGQGVGILNELLRRKGEEDVEEEIISTRATSRRSPRNEVEEEVHVSEMEFSPPAREEEDQIVDDRSFDEGGDMDPQSFIQARPLSVSSRRESSIKGPSPIPLQHDSLVEDEDELSQVSQPSSQHGHIIKDEVLEFVEEEEQEEELQAQQQQGDNPIPSESMEDPSKPTPVAHRFALPSANTQNSVQDEPRSSRRTKRNGLASKLVNLLERQKRQAISSMVDGTSTEGGAEQTLLVAIVFGAVSGFSYVAICAVVEDEVLLNPRKTKPSLLRDNDDALLDGAGEAEEGSKGSQDSLSSPQCLVDVLFPKEVAESLHLEPGKLVKILQPFQEFRISEGANPVVLCTNCKVVEGVEVLELVKPVQPAELFNLDRLQHWHTSPVLHPPPEVIEAQWQAIAQSIALAEGEVDQPSSSSQVDSSTGGQLQDSSLVTSDFSLCQNVVSLRLDEISYLSARVLELSVSTSSSTPSLASSTSLPSSRFQTILPFKSSLLSSSPFAPPPLASTFISAEVILRDDEGAYYKLLLQEPFFSLLDWLETLQDSITSSSSLLLVFRHLKALRRGIWSSRDQPPESVVKLEGLISKEYWILTTLPTSNLATK